MSNHHDDNGLDNAQLFLKSIKALLQLAGFILMIVHACTRIAPTIASAVIGVENHSNDSYLVTYFEQDEDGNLIDNTADKNLFVAKNLPPIYGVGSKGNGELVILYKKDNQYWRGDINGPQLPIHGIEPSTEIIDIATKGDGTVVYGLCKFKNELWDCIGDAEFADYLTDQKFIGLTLGDGSSNIPKPLCLKWDNSTDPPTKLIDDCLKK